MTAILIVLAVAVAWVILSYNRLVSLVQRAKEAFADITVQQKRRYDLIPNLVETVKGYAAHEQGTLMKVTEARNTAMAGGSSMAEDAANQNMITSALKSVFALSENYPDLKANTNFLELQRELTDTEDKIQASRRFYNGTVRDLHTAILVFPGNIIASIFHFEKMEFYEMPAGDASEQPVAVKF